MADPTEPPCRTVEDAIRRRIAREGASVNDAPLVLTAECSPPRQSEVLHRLERGHRKNG